MTREEAREVFEHNWTRIDNPDYTEDELGEAIDMAIEALSADRPTGECKQCTYWDKLDYEAPRQGWCNQFEEWTDADEYCSRCAMMRGESHE